jgi:hypothetical protein
MFSRKSVSKLVLVFSVLYLCFPGVVATQYVSFSDPDALTHKDLAMYGYNSTSSRMELLGVFNTTSMGIALPSDTDVQFVVKPQYSNPLDDPLGWLQSLTAYVNTYSVALFFIGILLGFVFRRV